MLKTRANLYQYFISVNTEVVTVCMSKVADMETDVMTMKSVLR